MRLRSGVRTTGQQDCRTAGQQTVAPPPPPRTITLGAVVHAGADPDPDIITYLPKYSVARLGAEDSSIPEQRGSQRWQQQRQGKPGWPSWPDA
jgi:hypothetical protein